MPEERADVDREAIVVRAIAVDVRLRLRPGAIEQRQEAMVKEVEEPAERRIAGVPQPLARVLGDVNRQRAVRAEQAEQPAPAAAAARRRARSNEASGAGANDRSGSCPSRTGSSTGRSARPQRGFVAYRHSSRRSVW